MRTDLDALSAGRALCRVNRGFELIDRNSAGFTGLYAFHTADAAHLAKLAGNAALIAVGTPYHGLRL